MLDTGTETAPGARLAVSSRHLRRIFNDQLGITPGQLARSRRAHFARRLLDDTDMAVADVAFASGFASHAVPGVESVSDGVYRRTISLDGAPGMLEIHPGGSEHLLLRAHLPYWEGTDTRAGPGRADGRDRYQS